MADDDILAEAFALVFRDYEIDGVPASGPRKVSKSEARALGALIQTVLSAAGSSLTPYATVAAMNAASGHETGDLFYVYLNNGSASDPANGVYQWNGTVGILAPWYFNAVAAVVQPLLDATLAAKTDAVAASSTAVAAAASLFNALDKRGLSGDYRHTGLAAFLDGAGKLFGFVGQDAGWSILLSKVATSAGLQIDLYETRSGAALVVADANNKILFQSADNGSTAAEVVTARGTKPSLNDRLSTALSPTGVLKSPTLGKPMMRRCHQKLMNRSLGESAQLNLALVGDSFTHNYDRWSGPLATTLMAKFGDGGGGWTGYGFQFAGTTPYAIGGNQPSGKNGNVRPATYTLDHVGGWVVTYNNSPSPDLAHVSSSTAGDQVKQVWPSTPVHTTLEMFWIGTADGVTRYRLNGGSWVTQNVQGTVGALSSVQITLPGGTTTFEVEVVSGTVRLAGSNLLSAASGVRIHKLAGGGARLAQWASQNATYQQSGWTKLAIHAFSIMDGTNTQGAGESAATWKGYLSTLIDRMRASGSIPDIAIVMPMENGLGRAIPMSDYAAAGRELSVEKSTVFRDLQPDFGLTLADYLFSSSYPLMDSDNTHPTVLTGGRLILAAMLGLIMPAPGL